MIKLFFKSNESLCNILWQWQHNVHEFFFSFSIFGEVSIIFREQSVFSTFLSLIFKRIRYCVKSVCTRGYSDPHFPAFGLNMERYGVSLHIQTKCGKLRTRITPNTDTFYVAIVSRIWFKSARKAQSSDVIFMNWAITS